MSLYKDAVKVELRRHYKDQSSNFDLIVAHIVRSVLEPKHDEFELYSYSIQTIS
jgi:hypothetical protein